LEPKVQVIEQRFDRAEVKNAQPSPTFGQHARDDWEKRGLGFTARSWGKHDEMLAIKYW
jgi:hypothetical protein